MADRSSGRDTEHGGQAGTETEGRPSRRRFLAALTAGAGAAALPVSGLSRTAGAVDPDSPFLLPQGIHYLDTGSLGPTSRTVFAATVGAWRELEANPSFQGYFRLPDAMESVRQRAARFVGCSAEEMVLTRGTTDGMNTVAQGLSLVAGDRVLTTDQEHPGGQSCWRHLARRHGVEIDTVSVPFGEHDAGRIVERMAAAWTPRTRALSVSHVLSTTGLRMPVAELSALARSRGAVSIVDGAQAVGVLEVDVRALGCDAYATSGHKWLLGPKGTGLLVLASRPDRPAPVIDPIQLEGGRGAYSASSGVPNIPGILGLGVALDEAGTRGMPAIEARSLSLRDRLYEGLRGFDRLGVRVLSPPPGPLASALLTFSLPEPVDGAALVTTLGERHGLIVKRSTANVPNGIRVSTHFWNSEAEIDRLLRALRDELRTGGSG